MISVTASGVARVGQVVVVPGSMLGAPSVSMPVLNGNGLPLGLQVLGFPQSDTALFAAAGWVEDMLHE